MDTTDRYILKAEGEAEINRLSDAVERAKRTLDESIAKTGAHSAATRAAAETYDRANRSLGDAQRYLDRLGGPLRNAQEQARTASYQFMAMAQTLDDLQYVPEMGLRPIVNNLMLLSPQIGIAALATDQLVRHWSELESLWKNTAAGDAAGAVNRLTDAAASAGKSGAQLSAEAQEQRVAAGAKAIATDLTPDEASTQKAVREALKGADRQEMVRAIVAQRGVTFDEGTPEAKERQIAQNQRRQLDENGIWGQLSTSLFNLFQRGNVTTRPETVVQQRENEALAKATARAEEKARQLIAAAETDEAALAELVDALKATGNASTEAITKLQEAQRAQREEAEERERLTQIEIEQNNRLVQSRWEAINQNLTQTGAENEAGTDINEARQIAAQKEARRRGKLDRYVQGYGEQFGEGLGGAMESAAGRGESPEDVDKRLRDQLAKRLTAVPEEKRTEVAGRIVQGRREQYEDYEQQQAMVRSVFGPLADPRVMQRAAARGAFGTAGRMQAQFAAKAQRGRRMQMSAFDRAQQQMNARQMARLKKLGIRMPDATGRVPGAPQAQGRQAANAKRSEAAEISRAARDLRQTVEAMKRVQVTL